MPKFLREHIIETLLSIVVALLAYIGTVQLEHIKEQITAVKLELNLKIDVLKEEAAKSQAKLENLQCETSNITVEVKFDAIKSEMLGIHLDARSTVGTYISKIDELLKQFGVHLAKCNLGNDTQAKIKSFRDGLSSYIQADFLKAIGHFSAIANPDSLTLKYLGMSLNSQSYVLMKRPEAKSEGQAMQERALTVIENAIAAASREINDISKRNAISRLQCGLLAEGKTEPDWKQAIECYHRLVRGGDHDYANYYNLSRLAALTKDYENSVAYMETCLQFSCDKHFTKRFVNEDGEFNDLFSDPLWGPKFRALYEQFK